MNRIQPILKPSVIAALLISAAFFVSSCAFDKNTLNSDEELFAVIKADTANNEDDIQDSTSTVASAPSPNHTGWARTAWDVASTTRENTDADAGAGIATMKVTKSITGTLKLATNWSAFQAGTLVGTKSFAMDKVRYFTAEKKLRVWRVTKVSYAIAASANPTVGIEKVTIYSSSNGTTVLQTIDSATMSKLFDRESLLDLPRNSYLRVEVKVTRTSTSVTPLAYIHHHGRRMVLYDDGTNGDTTSGDLTYSGVFYAGDRAIKHVHADVIDKAALDDTASTNNYSSVIWSAVFK